MKPHRADCLQYICTCGNRSEIEILRDDLAEKFEMAVRLENMARDKEIEELKAENARYREALEFYADVFLWCSPTIASNEYLLLTNKTDLGDGSFNFDDYSGRVCTDNNIAGRRAREALKGE